MVHQDLWGVFASVDIYFGVFATHSYQREVGSLIAKATQSVVNDFSNRNRTLDFMNSHLQIFFLMLRHTDIHVRCMILLNSMTSVVDL